MPDAALAAPIDQLDCVPRKTPLSPPRESALIQCCGLTTEFLAVQREVGAPRKPLLWRDHFTPYTEHRVPVRSIDSQYGASRASTEYRRPVRPLQARSVRWKQGALTGRSRIAGARTRLTRPTVRRHGAAGRESGHSAERVQVRRRHPTMHTHALTQPARTYAHAHDPRDQQSGATAPRGESHARVQRGCKCETRQAHLHAGDTCRQPSLDTVPTWKGGNHERFRSQVTVISSSWEHATRWCGGGGSGRSSKGSRIGRQQPKVVEVTCPDCRLDRIHHLSHFALQKIAPMRNGQGRVLGNVQSSPVKEIFNHFFGGRFAGV